MLVTVGRENGKLELLLVYTRLKTCCHVTTMRPNGFMARGINTIKHCSLTTDVDCSELRVEIEAVQAFLEGAKFYK